MVYGTIKWEGLWSFQSILQHDSLIKFCPFATLLINCTISVVMVLLGLLGDVHKGNFTWN